MGRHRRDALRQHAKHRDAKEGPHDRRLRELGQDGQDRQHHPEVGRQAQPPDDRVVKLPPEVAHHEAQLYGEADREEDERGRGRRLVLHGPHLLDRQKDEEEERDAAQGGEDVGVRLVRRLPEEEPQGVRDVRGHVGRRERLREAGLALHLPRRRADVEDPVVERAVDHEGRDGEDPQGRIALPSRYQTQRMMQTTGSRKIADS
jgi:hypothetical protein